MSSARTQYQTDEIRKLDRHLVHSFADLSSLEEPEAVTVIAEADGAHVYDSDGNRFIDGIGGLWCVNVGHARSEIADAVAAQLKKLDYFSTFYNLTHPLAAELSSKVASLAPGPLNHVYFANSGSVANDSAVRMLHHYFKRQGKPEKKRMLSRIGAYHGSTHLAIAMTTPAYREGWHSAEDIVDFLSSPYPYRRPDNMSEAEFTDFLIEEMVNRIEQVGAERIAGFIAEPILGAGGMIVPPDGYHRQTWEVCRRYEIKYISDEVVTAFGRLGHMFASKTRYDIEPDIITSAKGITSGYQPFSATIVSDEIYEVLASPGGKFLHGMTYSGHPAGCAAALANIAILENEDICGRVQRLGPRFESTLRSLEALDIVGEVRGSHFMMGIEFVKDKATKDVYDEEVNVGGMVSKHAQARGLIVRPLGHMIVLSPPLILTEEQIEDIGAVLGESIQATMDELAG